MRRRSASAVCGLLLLLALPAAAAADRGGDDEQRVRTGCLGGSAELRVRARDDDDGTLEIEVRIDARRAQTWRIVVLHERKLVYQGTRRATRSFRLRRTVADWPGHETITVRAVTAAGRACRLEATI